MDRLLSEQEQVGLIWELSATIEGSEGRQPTQEEIHDYLLKAQDAKTAHLVAQEIFKELEDLIPEFYIKHIQDYYAIKEEQMERVLTDLTKILTQPTDRYIRLQDCNKYVEQLKAELEGE